MSENPFNNPMESMPYSPENVNDDYWSHSEGIETPVTSTPTQEKDKAKKVLITSLVGVLVILVLVTALIVGRNFFHSEGNSPEPASDRVAVQNAPDADKTHTQGIAPKARHKQPQSEQSEGNQGTLQQSPNPSEQSQGNQTPTKEQSEGSLDLSQLTFSDIQTSQAMVLNKSVRSQDGVILFRVDYILSGTETKVFTYVTKSVFDSVKVGDVAELTFRTVNDGSVAIIR